MTAPKSSSKRGAQLDDKLQARLRAQAEAEQRGRARTRAIKRYVLLPGMLGLLYLSAMWMAYGDSTESLLGNLLGSSLVWFLWLVRKRLPEVFGFA